jgi:hypothetical protein
MTTVAELEAANERPPWFAQLTAAQINHLLSLNGPSVYCKGKRRHNYRPMIPGQPVPKTVDVQIVQGIVEVTETCPTCKRWVRRIADSRGVIDYTARPVYGGGQDGYIATGLDMPAWAYSLWLAWLQAEQVREALALRAARETPERKATKKHLDKMRGEPETVAEALRGAG